MLTWTKHEPKHSSVFYTATHECLRFIVRTYASSTPAVGWWWSKEGEDVYRGYRTAEDAMAAVEVIVNSEKEVYDGN